MTSGLRKAHTYIWLILVIIVPVVMFFSIKDLDILSSETNTSIITDDTSKKGMILSNQNEIIKASVYKNHLEIILKKTLKNSSLIVYEMDANGNKGNTIGQLTTVGIYNFETAIIPKGIIVYDSFKEIEITKLTI